MKVVAFLFVSILTVIDAHAVSGGVHSNAVPTYVLWQVINLIILAGLLYKYGKQPIADFFKARQIDYLKQAEKSKAIFQEAEKQYQDIQSRLEALTKTADESIEKAKKDAEEQKKIMISEAKTIAAQIKDEAQTTARLEAQKTTRKAKNDIVLQALAGARQMLTTDIAGTDHQSLQANFSKNIEAVNP